MTRVEGKLVDRRTGSLLWTHFGISGTGHVRCQSLLGRSTWSRTTGRIVPQFFSQARPLTIIDRWLVKAGTMAGRQPLAGFFCPERLPVRVAKILCSSIEDGRPDLPPEQTSLEEEEDEPWNDSPQAELRRSGRRALTTGPHQSFFACHRFPWMEFLPRSRREVHPEKKWTPIPWPLGSYPAST